MQSESVPMAANVKIDSGLYVTATPIGNLGDMSERGRAVLAAVDLILCEDTRVSQKLLKHLAIATPLQAYHEHNAAAVRPRILARLAEGARVALISDAGTPLISDPGFDLVREAVEADVPVTHLPGANAAVTALVLSGLPPDRFFFQGFLPPKAGRRRALLAELAGLPVTLIIYESPRRLATTLVEMTEVMGSDRRAAIARELTKMYEEVRRDTLGALAAYYQSAGAPKGEVVIVVEGAIAESAGGEEIDAALQAALARASLKDAVAEVSASLNVPRKQVYGRALALKSGDKQ